MSDGEPALDDDVVAQLRSWADDLAERSGTAHVPDEPSVVRPLGRRSLWPVLVGAAAAAAVIVAVIVVRSSDSDRSKGIVAATSPSVISTPDDTVSTTTTPAGDQPPHPGDVLGRPLVSGSWAGARTAGDGTILMVLVVGGHPYEAGDACTVEYEPSVVETADAVELTIRGWRPPGDVGCDDLGYGRAMTLRLEQPLGTRPLVFLGEPRPVFDGSALATPTYLPDGWIAGPEGPGYPDPQSAITWSRRWGPLPLPNSADRCTPSDSGIMLNEGPLGSLDGYPHEMGEIDEGTYDVNGATAVWSTMLDHGTVRLTWSTGTRAFMLQSLPACQGDVPPSLDTMLQIARGLVEPSDPAADDPTTIGTVPPQPIFGLFEPVGAPVDDQLDAFVAELRTTYPDVADVPIAVPGDAPAGTTVRFLAFRDHNGVVTVQSLISVDGVQEFEVAAIDDPGPCAERPGTPWTQVTTRGDTAACMQTDDASRGDWHEHGFVWWWLVETGATIPASTWIDGLRIIPGGTT